MRIAERGKTTRIERCEMRLVLLIVFLSTALLVGPSLGQDSAESPSLADRLAAAKRQFVGTWHADTEATQEYVKRRFGDEGKSVSENKLWKMLGEVAIRVSRDDVFRIVSRTTPEEEHHKGPFVLAIGSAGTVYFMGVDPDGEISSAYPIVFDKGRLVLFRHGKPAASDCVVFEPRE